MPDLEQELDRLYSLPLDDFTDARNDLARRLRKAGQRPAAEAVAALRKPPVPAWAINQLARRHDEDVSTLLEAGADLVAGQKDALAGKGTDRFDRAGRAQREAIRRLTRAAEAILKDAGRATGGQTLERIASSLRAASLDDEGRELLRRGRISEDVEATGLLMLASMVSSAPPRPRANVARKTDEREAARGRLAEAREQVKQARANEREARRTSDEEERRAEGARQAADAAQARARAAQAEAARATEAREQAERQLALLRDR